MLASELKSKYLKKEEKDTVGVIAIGGNRWWHIHDDEELPEGEFAIALHPRRTYMRTMEFHEAFIKFAPRYTRSIRALLREVLHIG